eukprot:1157762-Pelagomonas_calceolata.AAC.1
MAAVGRRQKAQLVDVKGRSCLNLHLRIAKLKGFLYGSIRGDGSGREGQEDSDFLKPPPELPGWSSVHDKVSMSRAQGVGSRGLKAEALQVIPNFQDSDSKSVQQNFEGWWTCQKDETACPNKVLDTHTTSLQLHGLLPPWPLLEACQQRAVSALLLMRFATEGDNQADGMELARQALSFLLLHAPSGVREQLGKGSSSDASSIQLQLRAPCSWAALYGRSTGILGLIG